MIYTAAPLGSKKKDLSFAVCRTTDIREFNLDQCLAECYVSMYVHDESCCHTIYGKYGINRV